MVKIGDFGQSRRVSLGRKMTANVRGSLLWRAPEMMTASFARQLPGSGSGNLSAEYGAAADVYSLGVIIWEIFSREEPYADVAQVWDIISKVRAGRLNKQTNVKTLPRFTPRFTLHCSLLCAQMSRATTTIGRHTCFYRRPLRSLGCAKRR
jgi:serine/threonine protein kinase